MTFFKKPTNQEIAAKELTPIFCSIDTASAIKIEEKEEWIWVEGYKGTDKDMKCRDFQFELGKEYSLPEDVDPVMCKTGFHLCLKLKDVFGYYSIWLNNRFFKVRALVERKEVERQTSTNTIDLYADLRSNKLVAKSIIFIEELSIDEIFKDTDISDFPLKYKEFAIKIGIDKTKKLFMKDKLTPTYGEKLASYIVEHEDLKTAELAYALADNDDLALYEKLLLIFRSNTK